LIKVLIRVVFILVLGACSGNPVPHTALLTPTSLPTPAVAPALLTFRRLPIKTYRDKIMAGWLGQMIGVSYGAPTEFGSLGTLLPEERLPNFKMGLANQSFGQDDLYVEMTFLRTLEQYGLDVPAAQAGIDFANSQYPLWHANNAGRNNLRSGIAPPDSGHPQFNAHADDIDYQIEADFAGLITPGLPDRAMALGEKFGRLMNYGDGLYGGQFMSCMYSEAFFETDVQKLVEAGLACIPPGSQYASAIRDVLSWWQQDPQDWQATWNRINAKYQLNPDFRRYSCTDENLGPKFDIDAKLNGAYVVLGLLYGNGDLLKSMQITMRAGQDSDCNPASAGGVLFTTIGFNQLPADFTSGLDRSQKWDFTSYNFDTLIDVCEKLARQVVLQEGGRIEKDASGADVLVIPVRQPQPGALEQSWQPGPIANSTFTDGQLQQISRKTNHVAFDLNRFAPGWQIAGCMDSPDLGLIPGAQGKQHVFFTFPANNNSPCRLTRTIDLPAGSHKLLNLLVSYSVGSWDLVVKANRQVVFSQNISKDTTQAGWLEVNVDLSAFTGQPTELELLNQPAHSQWSGAFWASITLKDK
jgi:hypothetical protein